MIIQHIRSSSIPPPHTHSPTLHRPLPASRDSDKVPVGQAMYVGYGRMNVNIRRVRLTTLAVEKQYCLL